MALTHYFIKMLNAWKQFFIGVYLEVLVWLWIVLNIVEEESDSYNKSLTTLF